MVALGVGLLMIAGEFDLSVGAVFVVAPFAMAFAYADAGMPLPVAILIALRDRRADRPRQRPDHAASFGIPSFITTLGMLFIVRTSAPFIVGYARSLTFKPPPAFREILVGNVGPIPAQFLWFLGFALHRLPDPQPALPRQSFLRRRRQSPTPRASPASTSSGPSSSPSCSARSSPPSPGIFSRHPAQARP